MIESGQINNVYLRKIIEACLIDAVYISHLIGSVKTYGVYLIYLMEVIAIDFVYLTHLIEVIGRYDVYGSRLNRWIDKDEVSIYRWIDGISTNR